jgi:hypothetical protein
MPDKAGALTLLSAMITPAVLISACGTLIFSTATRLSRIVDRVRVLGNEMERLPAEGAAEEQRTELMRQLATRAQRGRLIQRSLASLYVALGLFVGATISIAVIGFFPSAGFVPTVLGVAGTLSLFHGCVLLIRETQIALRSMDTEMEFLLRVRK